MRETEKKFFRNWQPYSKYVHVASPVRRDMTLSRKDGSDILEFLRHRGEPKSKTRVSTWEEARRVAAVRFNCTCHKDNSPLPFAQNPSNR